MSKYGTKEKPLSSGEAMKVARYVVSEMFETPSGSPGVWWMGSSFWVWRGGRWEVRSVESMQSVLWRWLEDAHVVAGRDMDRIERFNPTRGSVSDVMEGVKALTECPWSNMPVWVGGGEGRPAPETCIGFEDVVVSVAGGVVTTVERDEKWLDSVVVGVPYDPKAACPRWMRALEEWGEGDPKWGALLQRWFGYCLMSKRRYAKWLLMEGKTRAGKGVIGRVLRALLGGQAWFSTSLADLSSAFGLDGCEYARVMSITEFNKGVNQVKQQFGQVFKSVLGEDEVTINVKHQRQKRGVLLKAAPMIQSNGIPLMPNESEGISSKMLVLPFTVSWKNKPQFDLLEKLLEELGGIAAWAVEGARLLEAEGGRGWEEPAAAHDVRLRFRVANNPLDAFLESRLVKDEAGFVPSTLLWREWVDFVEKNQVAERIPRNQFLLRMEEGTTWGVKRLRKRVVRGETVEHVRGLQGVLLKKEVDDEI